MLSTALIAIVAFVSTNIDDIFVLVGFFSTSSYSRRDVVVGQFLGIGFLILVSVVLALLSVAFAPEYVGLLGFLPIAIGLKRLWSSEDQISNETKKSSVSKTLSVAGVTVANGGDNLGTYVPLFATISAAQVSLTVIIFAIMTALWCYLGYLFVHNRMVGLQIRTWGRRALPFVLISLGVYILWKTNSFSLILNLI
jgi:cadmium resistance protein CadD (predicted permease)